MPSPTKVALAESSPLRKFASEDRKRKLRESQRVQAEAQQDAKEHWASWAAAKDKLHVKLPEDIDLSSLAGKPIPFGYVGDGILPSEGGDGGVSERPDQYMQAGDRRQQPSVNSALLAVAAGRKSFWALRGQGSAEASYDLKSSRELISRLRSMREAEEIEKQERQELASNCFDMFVSDAERTERASALLHRLSAKRAFDSNGGDRPWHEVARALYQINPNLLDAFTKWSCKVRHRMRLPGKASLDKGSPTASTSADLSAVLWRGERIQFGSQQILSVSLDESRPFTSASIPLDGPSVLSLRGVSIHRVLEEFRSPERARDACKSVWDRVCHPIMAPGLSRAQEDRCGARAGLSLQRPGAPRRLQILAVMLQVRGQRRMCAGSRRSCASL